MSWIDYFMQFGYVGVFLISWVGALSIIIPIPYTISYYILGATMNPLFIAVSGGLGSALGELSGYLGGYFGQTFISEQQKKKMFYLMKIFDHYGPVLIFIFSLTPLPDDLLFIPLGMLKYSFVKAFIPCFFGKCIMAYILAYSGKVSFKLINIIFGESGLPTVIVTLILLSVIVVAIVRVDWEEIFNRYIEKK